MDSLVMHSEIGSRIITLRGGQVMLDRDIAEFYGVETKRQQPCFGKAQQALLSNDRSLGLSKGERS